MPTIVNGTGDERDEAVRAAPRPAESRAQPPLARKRAAAAEPAEAPETEGEMADQ